MKSYQKKVYCNLKNNKTSSSMLLSSTILPYLTSQIYPIGFGGNSVTIKATPLRSMALSPTPLPKDGSGQVPGKTVGVWLKAPSWWAGKGGHDCHGNRCNQWWIGPQQIRGKSSWKSLRRRKKRPWNICGWNPQIMFRSKMEVPGDLRPILRRMGYLRKQPAKLQKSTGCQVRLS